LPQLRVEKGALIEIIGCLRSQLAGTTVSL
jgi:hypothetical protein